MVAALAERYRRDPPPAAFRAIVSPLVAWIWIGGGIAVLGALVAVWPSPEARLRRVAQPLRGPPGPRALAGLGRPWSSRSPSSSSRPRGHGRAGPAAAAAGEVERRRTTARIAELEAAKEAKYREIRDAELDHRMGKLSEADWRVLDRELRGEAIEVLRQLDRLEGRPPGT